MERIFSRNYHFLVFQLQSNKSYTKSRQLCYWGSGSCESFSRWSLKLGGSVPGSGGSVRCIGAWPLQDGSGQSVWGCVHTCMYLCAKPCRPHLRLIAGHELREGDSIIIYFPNYNTFENEKDIIINGARTTGVSEMVPAQRIHSHLSLRWKPQSSPEGEVSSLSPCSQVCPSSPPPAFEAPFRVDEFVSSVLLGVRDCLPLCVFSDPFALGHRHVTLICPPGTSTRDLAWGLVMRRSRVSAELPTVSRCIKDGGHPVGPRAQGRVWEEGCRAIVAMYSRWAASQSPSLVLEFLRKWISHRQGVAVQIKCETKWRTVRACWSQFTLFHEQVLGLGFQMQESGSKHWVSDHGGGCQEKP